MTIPPDIGMGNRPARIDSIPDLATLSSVIRGYRMTTGETLQSLAERSGVSRSVIMDIESGLKSPTVGVLARLALAMNIRIDDLVQPPVVPGIADADVPVLECQSLRVPPGQDGLDLFRIRFCRYGRYTFNGTAATSRKHLWIDEGVVLLYLPGSVQEIQPHRLVSFNAGFVHYLECVRGPLASGTMTIMRT
ncbi:helix-turn-helix domain-containing protein [Parathalassolituus penaei]|uniref:Helix-turn-helix transcriptional regulator n=1 Tax=Parathalassolituus penaei TaxID=2997323 RepID=A0A9X3EFA3_9GAMM|nr:helix-turn-helix transcriptional regulator [Parathalassolituus penaei]MCY0966512.1 helix-turn-helix transcriptional regulator [Parathalassolituus penaei]